TRSGWVTFSASKLLLMNTPFAYSIVPIAPSQTRTRSSRASKNGFTATAALSRHSRVEPLASKRFGVDQQIRPRDDVEANRSDGLPHGVGEFVMMSEQMQPGPHGGQHLVDHRLARIDAAARRVERARRFVREKDIDILQAAAQDDF